jgi:hypothetical protein
MDLVSYYRTRNLLADGKSNTKMAKNKTKTYGLSLVPHTLNSSGENLCKFSTKDCRALCLNMTGRAGFDSVQKARLNKTDYFVQHKDSFVGKLFKELQDIEKKGEKCLVRLNVVSDIDWPNEFKKRGLDLAKFKNITFYAYTKNPFQIEANDLPNQHFTFSYSGGNWNWCEKFLKEKTANVAVVFKNALPLTWRGFKVINGDMDDERVLDEKGVIVGLKYKVPRGIKYEKNKFVVDE